MILKNCRLIPELCEGFQKTNADIRIEGNMIAEILPANGTYTDQEVIDCTGKTVLPGLFNIHNHLFFYTMDWPKIRGGLTEYEYTMTAVRFMNKLLSYGFTSLRDVGSPYNLAIKLRNDINAGKMVGPDIKACGIIITPTHMAPAELECYSSNYGEPCDSPYAVRAKVRKQIVEGADFIKILGCPAAPCAHGDGSLFYEDEMAELINTVNKEKSYLAIHTNSIESNTDTLNYEVYSLEHGHFWTKEHTQLWLDHGKKTHIVPTLQVTWVYGKDVCAWHCAGLMDAYQAGAKFGFGTDATEEVFTADPGGEFIARSEVWGIPSVEIFKQATIYSAEIMGTANERGSIKIGKRADFAIIDGNPDEDLTLMGKPCAYVLKDGVVVASNGLVKAI